MESELNTDRIHDDLFKNLKQFIQYQIDVKLKSQQNTEKLKQNEQQKISKMKQKKIDYNQYEEMKQQFIDTTYQEIYSNKKNQNSKSIDKNQNTFIPSLKYIEKSKRGTFKDITSIENQIQQLRVCNQEFNCEIQNKNHNNFPKFDTLISLNQPRLTHDEQSEIQLENSIQEYKYHNTQQISKSSILQNQQNKKSIKFHPLDSIVAQYDTPLKPKTLIYKNISQIKKLTKEQAAKRIQQYVRNKILSNQIVFKNEDNQNKSLKQIFFNIDSGEQTELDTSEQFIKQPKSIQSETATLISNLKQQNKELQQELQTTKLSIKTKIEEELNQQKGQMQTVLNQYQQFIQKLLQDKKELSNKLSQIDQLKNSEIESKYLDAKIFHEQQLSVLNQQLKNQKSQNQDLILQHQNSCDQVKQLKLEIQQTKFEKDQLNCDLNLKFNTQLKEFQQQFLQEKNLIIQNKSQQDQQLSNKVEQLTNQINLITTSSSQQEQQLYERIEQLTNDLNQSKQKNINDLKTYQSNTIQLDTLIKRLQNDLDMYKQLNEQQSTQLNQYQLEQEQSQITSNQIQKLNNELSKGNQQSTNVEFKYQELQISYKQQKWILDKLQSDLKQSNEENLQLKDQLYIKEKFYEQEIINMQQENTKNYTELEQKVRDTIVKKDETIRKLNQVVKNLKSSNFEQ